jgi:SNF2 family DNA or RNA helicase
MANSISPELYLYYDLKIEPSGFKAAEIKKRIDLALVCKNQQVLYDKDVEEHYKKIKKMCPVPSDPNIQLCFVEYEQDNHKITIIFYKVNNSELMTNTYINGLETKSILTCIHRTINLQNNLIQEHDKYFSAELDNIIIEMEKSRYYNTRDVIVSDPKGLNYGEFLTEYPLSEILHIKPYDYQKDNLNWMLELEKNPISDYINADKLLFLPDGRIYNYQQNKFISNEERELVQLKGGIISDNVGVGKTFQMLCLSMSKTFINTLYLVPDHLETHWQSQYLKHFNVNFPKYIKIMKFSDLVKNYDFSQHDRLVVDEIHELYSNDAYKEILNQCMNTGCKYKWGISATPFPVQNSLYFILKFLTEKELHYSNIYRFTHFYPTYYKIFRKNTLENIVNEIKLPDINEHNLMLNFSDHERILYDAETKANTNCDEYFLRKCCCDVMINYKSKSQIITLEDFNKFVLHDYKYKYDTEYEKLLGYYKFHNNCVEILDKLKKIHLLTKQEKDDLKVILNKTSEKDLYDNINHYKQKINEQGKVVADRKQAYEYLYNKINDDSKECPICLCDINDGDGDEDNDEESENGFVVPKCGHICHAGCMSYWQTSNNSCTVCRRELKKNEMYTVTKLEQVKLKYSTKIDKLIDIIRDAIELNPDEKFIVFTQFDNMISQLEVTLNTEGLGCMRFEDPSQINEFKNNPTKKALVLSSVKNASGIDLSFVSNIVIFEPIIGDTLFLRDIEKQIVGRIYRINQTKNINVYRLIIKDSIEEDIFKKALRDLKA